MNPVDKTSEEADAREPPSPRERPISDSVIKIETEETQEVHHIQQVEEAVEAEKRQNTQTPRR